MLYVYTYRSFQRNTLHIMAFLSKAFWSGNKFPFFDRYVFSFCFVLPAIIGFFAAVSQSGSQPMQGVSGHLAYWLISAILSWQLFILGTKATAYFLLSRRAPLIMVLIIGWTIGSILWVQVNPIRDVLVSGFVQEGQALQEVSRLSDLSVSLANWSLSLTIWIAANYLYYYLLGVPRFGYKPDAKRITQIRNWLLFNSSGSGDAFASDDKNTPRLVDRLNHKTNHILALAAEDHYTRVISQTQEDLIYIKFSDAITEMNGQEGLQVHRSYWLSVDAINSYWEKGHRAFVKLSNDQIVPVSRSFRQSVKQVLASKTVSPLND